MNRPAAPRPGCRPPQTDRPTPVQTATFPTGQWLAHLEGHRERLADLWEDDTPTEQLPATGPQPAARTAFPRVSTLPEPTDGRGGRRTPSRRPSPGTKGLRRRRPAQRPVQHPHLRAALVGLALAAALLTGLQLYAAAGISSARQAALAARTGGAAPATPAPINSSGISSADDSANTAPSISVQPDWVTRDTGAAYDRTDPTASPLDLPRCTTSPDTPLPCLAHVSADSRHAVVLEEDASLTALVRR